MQFKVSAQSRILNALEILLYLVDLFKHYHKLVNLFQMVSLLTDVTLLDSCICLLPDYRTTTASLVPLHHGNNL